MKKLLTSLAFVVFITLNTTAQLFQNTIGKAGVAEYGTSVAQAADSTYLVAGDYEANAFGETQPFIIRLRKNGSIEWSKKVNVPEQSIFVKSSYAETVKRSNGTPDGYIMLITEITYFYVVRLNNAGNVVWTRQFSFADNITPKIKPTYDAGGNLTGYIILARKFFNPNTNGVIIKINTTGNTLWQKRITSPTQGTEFRFADIKATADGGCIAAGNIYVNNLVSSPVLFRFSSIGTVVWRFSYVFNVGAITLQGVTVTSTGFATTGFNSSEDNVTLSVNTSGAINWLNTYSNGAPLFQSTKGRSIASDASGNLIIACGDFQETAAVLKLNGAGTVLFARRLNGASELVDIKVTAQGTYCAAGNVSSDDDISVVNISSTGTLNSGCQPESFTLSRTSPTFQLLGAPAFSIVNETLANTAITGTTQNIQTEQSLCGRAFAATETAETSNDKLEVANDLAGQRVVVKWQTAKTDDAIYEAILFNYAGMPVSTISLKANQPAYIQMHKMQAGIYSIALKQNSKLIAREKVVWIK